MNIIIKSINKFFKEIIIHNYFIRFIEFDICIFIICLLKDFFFKFLKQTKSHFIKKIREI